MEISDSGVKLKLQSVLNLTVRLFKTLEIEASNNMTLMSKWGFNGASGHSNYKQKMEGDNSSIFMCSLVPLKLVRDDIDDVIWENPKASSTFYCRPIYSEFAKENDLNIKEEINLIDPEIAALQPTAIGDACFAKHNMHMTMIDSKITSHLSDTSTATCNICKAKAKEMNDIDLVSQRNSSVDMFMFGLSSLHARIKMHGMHLAHCLPPRLQEMASQRSRIETNIRQEKEKFRAEMELLVDVVKQGPSYDGNTARRFFADPEATAMITGINEELIRRFGVILQGCCGEFVDVEKFR